MAREKETYRDHLAALYERFGRVELISLTQAAEYVGVCVRTLVSDKTFPVKKVNKQRRVSVINLARWLAV